MTVISSRPDELMIIGSGEFELNLTTPQLELLVALVYQCRLGKNSPYSVAAGELLGTFSDEFGDDFMDNAANRVNLQATIEDDYGSTILDTRNGSMYITLEV